MVKHSFTANIPQLLCISIAGFRHTLYLAVFLGLMVTVPAAAQDHVTISRQKDWVITAAFVPSGSCVAFGAEGKVKLYSPLSESFISEQTVHSNYLQSLVVSDNGGAIFSVGWDGNLAKIPLTETAEGIALGPSKTTTLRTTRPAFISISHNNAIVATNGKKDEIDLYDTASLTSSGTIPGIGEKPNVAVFNLTDAMLLVGGTKGRLLSCSVNSFDVDRSWGAHSDIITGIVFDMHGRYFVSSSKDGELKKWDATNYRELQKADLGVPITSLVQSADGKYLFAGTSDGSLHVLDQSFAEVSPPLKTPSSILCLAIDRKQHYLFAGLNSKESWIWNLHSIKALKMAYDEPCRIAISYSFDDANELVPNGAIDGGEKPIIHVDLKNEGPGNAYDVVLTVKGDNPAVSHGTRFDVGDIYTGQTARLNLPLEAPLDIKDGKLNLFFRADEAREFDAAGILAVTVFHLPRPNLSISKVELDDRNSGNTVGNGNGVPENGETIDVVVFIKNSGEGPTRNTNVSLVKYPHELEQKVSFVTIPPIDSGETETARLRISIPRTYGDDSLSLSLKIEDTVTETGTSITKAWPLRKRAPILQARIESPQELENGSSARILVYVENVGTMRAEGIQVTLSGPGSVTIRDHTITLGKLESKEKRSCVFDPVSIPEDFPEVQATFMAKIAQDNFPGVDASETFGIRLKKTDLIIVDTGPGMSVRQGSQLKLILEIHNRGDFDASGVEAAVTIDRLKFNESYSVGKIPKNQISVLPEIARIVPSGIDPGPLEVRVTVKQDYFGTIAETLQYDIVAAEVPVTQLASSREPKESTVTRPGYETDEPVRRITVFGIAADSTVRSSPYRLKVIAQSKYGIENIKVSLNGYITYQLTTSPSDREVLRQFGGNNVMVEVELRDFIPGTNTLEISLQDKRNDFTYDKRILRYEPHEERIAYADHLLDPNIDVNNPPRYKNENADAVALLIGISRYQKREIPDVDFAVLDCLAVKRYLIESFGYKPENILEYYDEQATKTNIEVALKTIVPGKIGTKNPDVLFYYSGHGGPNPSDRQGYLIPYDCDPLPLRIAISGYPLRELYSDLRNLAAGSIQIVLDACFSGESPNGSIIGGVSPVAIVTNDEFTAGANGILLSAAGSGEYSSWYEEKKHGLFTYYFLKGLLGAADNEGDRNKEISYKELYQYVRKNVTKEAAQRGRSQTPELRGDPERVIIRMK